MRLLSIGLAAAVACGLGATAWGQNSSKGHERPGPAPTGTPTSKGHERPAPRPDGTPSSQGHERPAPRPDGTPSSQGHDRPTPRPDGTPNSQGHDRPTPRPDGTPSSQGHDRPHGIPGQTADSRGMNVSLLDFFNSSIVRQELFVSSTQQKTIETLRSKMESRIDQVFGDAKDFSQLSDADKAMVVQIVGDAESKLFNSLTKRQQEKLLGIYASSIGPMALANESVQNYLGMSDSQEYKIETIACEACNQLKLENLSDDARRQVLLQSENKLLNVLDHEQRQKFEQMLKQRVDIAGVQDQVGLNSPPAGVAAGTTPAPATAGGPTPATTVGPAPAGTGAPPATTANDPPATGTGGPTPTATAVTPEPTIGTGPAPVATPPGSVTPTPAPSPAPAVP